MGMPETARSWTREMVLALPDDGNRYELFDGLLLVTPAPRPRHEEAVMTLLERLFDYLGGSTIGRAYTSPSALTLNEAQYAQPDIYVLPGPRRPAPDRWEDLELPILVVEVLSPSTAWNDRQVKRRKFQRLGIQEYWIVDLDARLVERWKPADSRPEILTEVLEWRPAHEDKPLTIDLSGFFDGILGPR